MMVLSMASVANNATGPAFLASLFSMDLEISSRSGWGTSGMDVMPRMRAIGAPPRSNSSAKLGSHG